MGKELAQQCAILRESLKRFECKVFKNTHVTPAAKRTILQMMVMAKGVFQAGSWPTLARSEYAEVKATTIKLYRLLCVDGYSHIRKGDGCLRGRLR